MAFEVTTRGIPEVRAALEGIKGKVDPVTGKALSKAAEPVRDDARGRAEFFSARTAAGIRIRRRGVTVRVEQGQRKTTGLHPQFGFFQQRKFFDPALEDNKDEVVERLSEAIDGLIEREGL